MEHLSENTIKKIALSFLKVYYKHRPRIGETIGQLDLVTESGIISDGQLSFITEEGKNFTAAFEATAVETREEVYFLKQNRLLIWDAVAVSAVLSGILFFFLFQKDLLTIKQIGVFGESVLLVFSLILFALIYRILAGGLGRYRYIYAVEQFKKFHADEQWIVVEEGVFEGPLDANFLELRKQAILNGFGLLEITRDEQPRLLITPSREVVFERKRKIARFLERVNLRQKINQTHLAQNINQLVETIKPESGGGKNTRRYQKSLWHQLTIISFSLTFIGFIFWRQLQDRPVVVLNEEENLERLELISSQNRETDTFEMEPQNFAGKRKKTEPYLIVDESKTLTEPDQTSGNSKNQINVQNEKGSVEYDCSRFYNLVGTNYILAESEFKTLELAAKRLAELRKAKLEANCVWMTCFEPDNPVYVVYLDLIFENKTDAKKTEEEYDKLLKKKSLWKNPVSIISIKNPK